MARKSAADAGIWPRLQQLAAAARDSDALAVLLADGELPALVLAAAEQLREQPPAAPARMQLVVDLCACMNGPTFCQAWFQYADVSHHHFQYCR